MFGLVIALCTPVAWAGTNDITLSGMTEHGGQPVSEDLSDDYLQLVRELGTVVANRSAYPAATLGSAGFSLAFQNAWTFTDLGAEAGVPTPWERATGDERVAPFLAQPGFTARKGFPFSLEAGVSASWIGGTRQGTFGGFGRLGIVEGSKPWPDLSVHLGYSGFVGNDELELAVLDAGATLGAELPFGSVEGFNNATFSPWFDYSLLRIQAFPVLSDEVADAVGAVPVSGRKSDDGFRPQMLVHRLTGGVQITNGTVTLRIFGHWSPKATAGFSLAMGFDY